MDPNANLDEQRVIVARMQAREGISEDAEQLEDGERLADLVFALDDWLVGGGFLPASWQQPPLLSEQHKDDAHAPEETPKEKAD